MYTGTNLMALAILPGLLLIIYVYTKDKVEKEPIGVILKLVVFGAISCFLAGYVNTFRAASIPYQPGTLEYALNISFLVAAVDEEILKFLALRLGSWNTRAFNYRFDGVVYGLSAAVGFAVLENITYVAQYGFSTAIVRAFTAVPLHAFCGVFMGVFYSYSKKSSILGRKADTIVYTVLSLLVPMLIHGTYDTFAFLGESGTFYLLAFVVLLYTGAIITIRKLSAADYRAGFYPRARTINYDIEI